MSPIDLKTHFVLVVHFVTNEHNAILRYLLQLAQQSMIQYLLPIQTLIWDINIQQLAENVIQ